MRGRRGYAAYFHGHPRDTGGIDIVIRPTLENAPKVADAVAAFGAGGLGYSAEDYLSKDFIQIGISPVRIDITCSFDGVPLEKLWGERVAGRVGEAAGFFPSKECLILNKRGGASQGPARHRGSGRALAAPGRAAFS